MKRSNENEDVQVKFSKPNSCYITFPNAPGYRNFISAISHMSGISKIIDIYKEEDSDRIEFSVSNSSRIMMSYMKFKCQNSSLAFGPCQFEAQDMLDAIKKTKFNANFKIIFSAENDAEVSNSNQYVCMLKFYNEIFIREKRIASRARMEITETNLFKKKLKNIGDNLIIYRPSITDLSIMVGDSNSSMNMFDHFIFNENDWGDFPRDQIIVNTANFKKAITFTGCKSCGVDIYENCIVIMYMITKSCRYDVILSIY